MLTKHCEFIKEKYTLPLFARLPPGGSTHIHMHSVDARKESEAGFLTSPPVKKMLHPVYRRTTYNSSVFRRNSSIFFVAPHREKKFDEKSSTSSSKITCAAQETTTLVGFPGNSRRSATNGIGQCLFAFPLNQCTKLGGLPVPCHRRFPE